MILDFTISNFRSIKETQTISFEATNDSHLEDYYVVKKGDTLWEIANRYNTTIKKIIEDNDIENPNLIYPGTVLKV